MHEDYSIVTTTHLAGRSSGNLLTKDAKFVPEIGDHCTLRKKQIVSGEISPT